METTTQQAVEATFKSRPRIYAGVHTVGVPITDFIVSAKAARSNGDGHPYDVVTIADVTFYLDRAQTTKLAVALHEFMHQETK